MSITVGTNVFISEADADTYFSLIGVTEWAALDSAAKEIALRLGTSWIERVYWNKLQIGSTKSVSTQALLFPRDNLLDWEGFAIEDIPDGVAHANAELALSSTTEDLDPDIPIGGLLKRKKIGPIEKEWFAGSIPNKIYQKVTSLMEPYLESTTTGIATLVRV